VKVFKLVIYSILYLGKEDIVGGRIKKTSQKLKLFPVILIKLVHFLQLRSQDNKKELAKKGIF
jgi:hypothetical protein